MHEFLQARVAGRTRPVGLIMSYCCQDKPTVINGRVRVGNRISTKMSSYLHTVDEPDLFVTLHMLPSLGQTEQSFQEEQLVYK